MQTNTLAQTIEANRLDAEGLALLDEIRSIKADLTRPGIGAKITNIVFDTLLESRVGGQASWPVGHAKPVAKGSFPLIFLAQINLSEVSAVEGFPSQGLLQFFIASDDLYGLGLPYVKNGERFEGSDFVVVLHTNLENMKPWVQFTSDEETFRLDTPFFFQKWWNTGFKLEFGEVESFPPSLLDHRIEAVFNKLWKKYGDNDQVNELRDQEFTSSSWDLILGGNAKFVQPDPRGYLSEFTGHDLNLVSFDSSEKLLWGDWGTGSFFANPEDLQALDFSNLFGNYDSL